MNVGAMTRSDVVASHIERVEKGAQTKRLVDDIHEERSVVMSEFLGTPGHEHRRRRQTGLAKKFYEFDAGSISEHQVGDHEIRSLAFKDHLSRFGERGGHPNIHPHLESGPPD